MTLKGHVENGVIVLDDPIKLDEGLQVEVAIGESTAGLGSRTPFRGTPYSFPDPFSPVLSDKEWGLE
ncbi:MAG: hypothetical protein HYV26_04615 [Candidatus Hydrogenedentes bacterium]|nr:hypothetical protein [Candidatus Hydrogenedentota bacterium]